MTILYKKETAEFKIMERQQGTTFFFVPVPVSNQDVDAHSYPQLPIFCIKSLQKFVPD